MEKKLDKLLDRMNEIEKSLKSDILKTNNEIGEIKEICLVNQQKYIDLDNIVKQQKVTINYLHKEVNKSNLIVFGMTEVDDTKVLEEFTTVIKEKLNIQIQEEDICKIYRMKNKQNDHSGPVKVGFFDYKLKTRIYNARFMLKGTQIFLNDDLPIDLRIQNKEKRMAREQRNKKRLKPQSSEENDTVDQAEVIAQEVKRIKNVDHQLGKK